MSFRSVVVLAASLAFANAHMIMDSPVPYSVDKLDNGPITADQYPCKSNLGYTVSTMNQMAVGTTQKLTFKGSAVHGGGSCQLSVTTDTEPTKNSVFKVIKSIEGGCPGIEKAESFDFELPDSIPNGKATFAWTWFAKLSGGPEMYMNCAPIEVTGGASDSSAFNALPDMLVANIATSSCKSQTSKALKFPNPGSEVQVASDGSDVVDPSGDCGTSGSTPSEPSEPTSPAGGEPSVAPTSAAGGNPSATAAPSAAPSNPGGVFAPGASSAAPAVPSAAPVVPSAAPLPTQTSTTLLTVTANPTAPSPAKPTTPSSPGTGTPAQPSSPSSGGGTSTTCSTNGAVVCNGEKQFGLCNNGNVVWQAVAAGTSCVNGVISKREYNGRIVRPRYASPKAMPIVY